MPRARAVLALSLLPTLSAAAPTCDASLLDAALTASEALPPSERRAGLAAGVATACERPVLKAVAEAAVEERATLASTWFKASPEEWAAVCPMGTRVLTAIAVAGRESGNAMMHEACGLQSLGWTVDAVKPLSTPDRYLVMLVASAVRASPAAQRSRVLKLLVASPAE